MRSNKISLTFSQDFFKNYARSRPCQIRVAALAGYSCAPVETTVLCHPSVAGLKATGSRRASVPDIGAAHGCHVCHALVDGALGPKAGSTLADLGSGDRKMILQNAILEGVIRTIDLLVKEGVLPNP